MLLFLLRHTDAATIAASDEARTLSEKGEAQARKVARFCEANELLVSLVLTSPVRRAQQTARIVASHLRAKLVVAPWLACGMRPQSALEELAEYSAQQSLMIVGHEPDFSALAAHLLGLPSGSHIEIRKGSLTLLEVDAFEKSGARLDFSVPSRLM